MLPAGAVGLDIEWKPTFVRGAPPSRIALIQVSTPELCVLVHARHLPKLPPSLLTLLAQPSTVKLGCGIDDDAIKLGEDLGVVCAPCLELGQAGSRLEAAGRVRSPVIRSDS